MSLPSVLGLIEVAATYFTLTYLHAMGTLITRCYVENRLYVDRSGSKVTN